MIMNKKIIINGIVASIVLQLFVLIMEYTGAVYPLWTGQEITLKIIPIDPRSLFRGNYARLNYDISSIPKSVIEPTENIRWNEIIYIKLKPGTDGVYQYDGASLSRPESGLFIRGRVSENSSEMTRVRFGIEAFFAPKEKALLLERELRSGGLAKVMLANNGKAALRNIEPSP